MNKKIYIVTPHYENEDETTVVFQEACVRLTASFPDDELTFEPLAPYDNDLDKQMLALRAFTEIILNEPDVIFFFAGNFVDDSFCMSAMTICKMYHIAAMLDKRVVMEDYKKDLKEKEFMNPPVEEETV